MTPSLESSYAEISLTNGQFAIVDAAEFEWLNQWKWSARQGKYHPSWYAIRGYQIGKRKEHLGNRTILMHREILGLSYKDGKIGDHINGNTLDNRRCNLRVATAQQNTWNRKRDRKNTSGYRGISWYARDKKWRALLCFQKKYISLGLYDTPEEAYAAWCVAAKSHHGEFFRAE